MSNIRLIPRLDIKGSNLIKGIHLEGLRVIGNPNDYAKQYYFQGADEIIYMDLVASLYGRNHLADIVKHTSHDIFVPLTVGGGIRSVEDARQLLLAGADKIAVNSAAVKNPDLIEQLARKFGTQCVVLSLEAKKVGIDKWEPYTDCGRERSGIDAIEWVKHAVSLGAGEILVTSIDKEGTRKGFDVELTRAVAESVSIPVIASGGMGKFDDLLKVVVKGKADAVAMADVLHYGRISLKEIRTMAIEYDINVRKL